MRIKSILVGLVLAASLAAPAAAKTYHCKFTKQGGANGIPEKVIILHDEKTGAVTVNDPLIQYYVGAPIAGTLKSMNKTRALFSWSLPSLKDAKGHWIPGVVFSVNILLASGQASISGKPQGNYVAQRGTGACTIK